MFIHCGLSELVVCGETELAAANLRIAVNNLERQTGTGITGLQKHMQVMSVKRLSTISLQKIRDYIITHMKSCGYASECSNHAVPLDS